MSQRLIAGKEYWVRCLAIDEERLIPVSHMDGNEVEQYEKEEIYLDYGHAEEVGDFCVPVEELERKQQPEQESKDVQDC